MDLKVFKIRLAKLKEKLRDNNIETAIITDEDNVYYLCGYYDYLHMDFGRPTLLIISVDQEMIDQKVSCSHLRSSYPRS